MPKNKITAKILIFLLLTDVLETFIQYCFKNTAINEGTFEITNIQTLFSFVYSVIGSGYLWIGIISVITVFIIWSSVLSKIDLSVAVPIASFSYILVPLISIIFLHEKISALRWLGIFFVLAGVIFVSISAHKDESTA